MIPLFAALLLQSTPAATAACTAIAPPPAGLEAWTTVSGLTTDPVPTTKTTGLKLKPSADVRFALAPGRTPAPRTFGGVYHVSIKTAGAYRVALSAGAWIDIVNGGKSLESAAHTEGPACSGIRKIVDFFLTPGSYVFQLSGAKSPEMRVLITLK